MLKQILVSLALFVSASSAFTCKIKGSETTGETCEEKSVGCASTFDSAGKRVLFKSVKEACVTAVEFKKGPFYGKNDNCGMMGSQLLCWCNDDKYFGCNTEDRMEKYYKEYMKHTTTVRTSAVPTQDLTCKTKDHEKMGETCPAGSVACVADMTGGKRRLFSSAKDACVSEQDFKSSAPYKGRQNYCGYYGSKVFCWCNLHSFFGCNTEDRLQIFYKEFKGKQ